MPSRAPATPNLIVIEDANETYGQLLKERREALGLSQIELAQLAGVHRGTIRNAELGKSLELRTHSNLLRSLGCAPNVKNWDDRESPRLDEVLSARVAGLAAHAVLEYPGDAQRMIAEEYFELVSELAKGRQLDGQTLRTADLIAAQMRPADQKVFTAEIVRGAQGGALTHPAMTDLMGMTDDVNAVVQPRTVQGTAFIGSPKVSVQYSRSETSPLSRLIAEGVAGEPGLAQLVLQGIEVGVPQQVISDVLQADIADEAREKLLRHAMQRAAEAQRGLINEMSLLLDVLILRRDR